MGRPNTAKGRRSAPKLPEGQNCAVRPTVPMFAVFVARESKNRTGVEALGRANVPAGPGPGVVVADETRFEYEMIANTVGEVSFVHRAASIDLGRDDVIFCVREVEPVLRAVIEFETHLRPPIILGDAVANSQVVHLAVVIHGSVKGIASQSTERGSLA